MTDAQTVLVELLVSAPIDDVWRALRDPAEVQRWFGWKYPGLKEEIDLIFLTGSIADEREHCMRIPHTGDVFTLEAQGDRTIVRLVRAAPAEGTWEGIYDDIVEGWTTFLQQLRFTLERHARDERRTLYLSGRLRHAADHDPIRAVGLDSLAATPPGGRYTLRAATGDTLNGSVWFRSKYQTGVTVDEFGDGLLIVALRPPTDAAPHGSGSALLTLYGLDEAGFETLRARWHDWWAGAFELSETHPAPDGDAVP